MVEKGSDFVQWESSMHIRFHVRIFRLFENQIRAQFMTHAWQIWRLGCSRPQPARWNNCVGGGLYFCKQPLGLRVARPKGPWVWHPLLGRAAVLRCKVLAHRWLTDGLGRLRLICCQAEGDPFCSCPTCSIVDRLEKRLCFLGPSPRTLFKDLRIYGPLADNPLEWWRGLVQEPVWVSESGFLVSESGRDRLVD